MREEGSASKTHPEFWTYSEPKYLDFGWALKLPYKPTMLPGPAWPEVDQQRAQSLARFRVDLLLACESFAVHAAHPATTSVEGHRAEEIRHRDTLATYREIHFKSQPWLCERTIDFLRSLVATGNPHRLHEFLARTVEPLATAILWQLHSRSADPLLVRMCSFILADEDDHRGSIDSPADAQLVRNGEELFGHVFADCAASTGWPMDVVSHALFADGVDVEYGPCADLAATSVLRHLHPMSDTTRARVKRAASEARSFLASLNVDGRVSPPAALAVEWLAAGLRSTTDLTMN